MDSVLDVDALLKVSIFIVQESSILHWDLMSVLALIVFIKRNIVILTLRVWKESLYYCLYLGRLPCAWPNFLRKYLIRNKFISQHTNVEYTLVFSLFDNRLWKVLSKLIESVWCSGTKSFPINTSVKPKVHEWFQIVLSSCTEFIVE